MHFDMNGFDGINQILVLSQIIICKYFRPRFPALFLGRLSVTIHVLIKLNISKGFFTSNIHGNQYMANGNETTSRETLPSG